MITNSLQIPRRRAFVTVKSLLMQVSVLLAQACIASMALADPVFDAQCGILNPPGQYGPFDYRTATTEQKYLVEIAHFTPEIETLHRNNGVHAGGDIDYTLRALPNHPRALKAMMDLGIAEKTSRPRGSRWPVECYFNRAIRFAADDAQVRMLYGIFLLRNGEKQKAVAELELARSIGASSANFHYNLGLAYFQVQDYEKARLQAYKAKELGYELEGLKNLLTRAGQWKDPPPTPSEATDPIAPAPAPASTEPQTPAAKN